MSGNLRKGNNGEERKKTRSIFLVHSKQGDNAAETKGMSGKVNEKFLESTGNRIPNRKQEKHEHLYSC